MKRGKDRQRVERARRARQRRRRTRAARRSPILHALTASTLALQGIAGSAAAEPRADQITGSYSFSRYTEDDISSSKVAAGSTSRYEIDVHQLRFAAPITDRIDLALDLAHETMSGATPWYINPPNISGGEDSPRVVMTGASIEDTRTDALLKGTYRLDWGSVALSTGVSVENDYLAFNGGFQTIRDYNEKNTTLTGGLGFSYDLIDPTQDGTPGRVSSEDRHSVSLMGGISQVLGRKTTVLSTLSYQYAGGFLSDPYKQVFVGGPIMPDSRPDQRHRITWQTRLRRHFETLGSSLHLDYSLYYDDWGINAHTIEAAWYQSLFGLVRLIPSVRYYSQSQAEFYAPWFDSEPSDGLYSSDYRLSPYGALSYRIRAETRLQSWELDWILNVGYERYRSSGDLALGKVSVENPGLVSFDMFSVGFTGRF